MSHNWGPKDGQLPGSCRGNKINGNVPLSTPVSHFSSQLGSTPKVNPWLRLQLLSAFLPVFLIQLRVSHIASLRYITI